MSVTNGFLRLLPGQLAALLTDAVAFESRCRDYTHTDYLDMDKAGYELLFILDPSSIEYDNPNAEKPFPAISAVLSGGETVHQGVDLGYSPAKLIDEHAISDAVSEISGLTLQEVTSTALESELLPEVLMCDLDAELIEEYHWPHLQGLAAFLREAQKNGMAVLRY